MRTRLNVALHVHRLFRITLVTQTQTTHETSPLFLLLQAAFQNFPLALLATLFCYIVPKKGLFLVTRRATGVRNFCHCVTERNSILKRDLCRT
jgi:hypothetical protein